MLVRLRTTQAISAIMSLASDPLPTDPEALRQFAAGLQTELARKEIEIAANAAEIHAKTLHIEQLKAQLAVLRRARFGRSSEKLGREICRTSYTGRTDVVLTRFGTREFDERVNVFCRQLWVDH